MFLIVETIFKIELIYFLFGTLSFIIPLIIVLCVISPKNKRLRNKFLSLGQIVGRSYGEIVLVCGSPDSSSFLTDNYNNQIKVCEWVENNTKIVLIFNLYDVCIDISPTTNIYN